MKLFNFLKKEDTNKKLKLQYLANLFLVAKSDGIVSKEEEDKIDEIRKSIGITEDEYEKLTKSILSGNFGSKNFVSPKSDEEAWNQLIECVNLITIDGKIDNAEIQTCKDLAKAMGYNESDIDELLPKEVLKSFNDSKKIKFNNQTLRTAIEDWLEYPISAEATYGHISGWDTSKVTDMSKLFLDAHTFNEPLNNWDVSNVTNMHAMFDNAYAFNQPLNNWEVGNVTDMSEMFSSMEALAFNQPIGNWDVSNVTNMYSMFSEAKEFNQPIGDWDVSNVTDMQGMFFGAKSFNKPIENWDLNSVTDMKGMFYGATAFNQPISGWDISGVSDREWMFVALKPHQIISSNKPPILPKTQTNSVQRKGISYLKKLFKSRDYVEIDSGLHFMNSLNDAVLYEYFLRGNSITVFGNFMRSNFFSGTGPAQPYFDYILLSLINDAPAKTKMDQSLKRTSIKRIHLEAEIPYHAGMSYTKNCGKYSAFKLPDLAFKNLEEISIFNYQNLESLKFLLNCKKLKKIELTRCDNIKDADLFKKQILKNK